MVRCFLEHCKKKLNRYNTYRVSIVCKEDTFTDKAERVKICIDCAKLYFGKNFSENEGRFMGDSTAIMEFHDEFEEEINNSLDKKFTRRPPQK